MSFHDVRFPEHISYGSQGGPEFNTTVLPLASGHEKRNINWSAVRSRFDVSQGIKDREQMEEVRDFFMARMGRAYSFRFKDWMDFQFRNQLIGTGTGDTLIFPLIKSYVSAGYAYHRRITKPIQGTIEAILVGGEIFRRNANIVNTPKTFHLDHTTGIVAFHADNTPASGAEIVVPMGEFDVHVRFDTDHFNVQHDFWETMSWEDIPLIEIKESDVA